MKKMLIKLLSFMFADDIGLIKRDIRRLNNEKISLKKRINELKSGREGKCSVSYKYTDDLNERWGGESLEYYTCKCCGHRSRSYNFTRVKSK